jgi:hypothetical protein
MKSSRLLWVATLFALLLAGGLLYEVMRLRNVIDEHHKASLQVAPAADYELAVPMARMQYHMEKLYWATQARNAELARFYAHELDEVAEDIEAAGVVDEGVDISQNLRLHLHPALEALEADLNRTDWQAINATYVRVVNSCNNCHAASKHGFIRIQTPTRAAWSNQDFMP